MLPWSVQKLRSQLSHVLAATFPSFALQYWDTLAIPSTSPCEGCAGAERRWRISAIASSINKASTSSPAHIGLLRYNCASLLPCCNRFSLISLVITGPLRPIFPTSLGKQIPNRRKPFCYFLASSYDRRLPITESVTCTTLAALNNPMFAHLTWHRGLLCVNF